LVSLDRSLIVQVVNFLILLVILQRLLYKPFLAKMQERTAAIQKSLEEAQAARAEAARQQEENAARLRSAYQEAAAIRAQALKEAAEEQRKLVEAAQVEARRLVETARAQTDADIRRARDELRREGIGRGAGSPWPGTAEPSRSPTRRRCSSWRASATTSTRWARSSRTSPL